MIGHLSGLPADGADGKPTCTAVPRRFSHRVSRAALSVDTVRALTTVMVLNIRRYVDFLSRFTRPGMVVLSRCPHRG